MPGGPPAPAASALSCRNVPPRNGAGSNSCALQLASAPLSSRGARRLGAGEKSGEPRSHACHPAGVQPSRVQRRDVGGFSVGHKKASLLLGSSKGRK